MSNGNPAQILAPSVGWAIVVSLGIGFAFLMVGISFITNRWTDISIKSNEEFSNASRTIKTGLLSSGIVSAWTWSATLLTSSTVAYNVGVSGGYWYGAGGTLQVLFFAILATQTKIIAPHASTYLSIVRARYGTFAHFFYMFFALSTNVLVSSMLVVGGADTVTSLTGMPTIAAIFLTPISVTIYVLTGGMRASLVSDYLHTTVLLAMLMFFTFVVYATSDEIGSPSRMVELLEKAAALNPVKGNGGGGSYLTMRSHEGLMFFIITLIAGSSTTTMDQAYHNRGVASRAESISKSFLLGGLSWTFIPLVIATSLGLAARALELNLTLSQVSGGLAAPAAAAHLLGKPGAIAILILLFLAVTSAASAQLVAVSCIFTYDIYQVYMNPKASERQVFWASHLSLGAWGLLMGIFGLAFFEGGIDLGWLYTFLGMVLGGAVFPIVCCICWKKASRNGSIFSTSASLCSGIITWLVSAKKLSGEISIASLGTYESSLAGSTVAFFLPMLILTPWSLIWPDNFDWEITRKINSPHIRGSQDSFSQEPMDTKATSSVESLEPEEKPTVMEGGEKQVIQVTGYESSSSPANGTYGLPLNEVEDLEKSLRSATWTVLILSFVLIFFIPCIAIIPEIWNETGLAAWVGIGVGMLFFSSFICVILPVWESRESLRLIGQGMWKDIRGKRG